MKSSTLPVFLSLETINRLCEKMQLHTLKSFENPIDAHLLRTKLEVEGISCYLVDEHIVSLNPIYSNAVGGIKLKVAPENFSRAMEIVAQMEQVPLKYPRNNKIQQF